MGPFEKLILGLEELFDALTALCLPGVDAGRSCCFPGVALWLACAAPAPCAPRKTG